MTIHALTDSPIGAILLVGDGEQLAGLYTAEHVRPPKELGVRRDDAFAEVRGQLSEYFAGERAQFDVALIVAGTPFQQRVWDELRKIDYGQTASYGQIAARLQAPKAVRAVGAANGRNLISIIVPCHRVVGGNGTLTGYAGGLEAKRWLLAHETKHRATLSAASCRDL